MSTALGPKVRWGGYGRARGDLSQSQKTSVATGPVPDRVVRSRIGPGSQEGGTPKLGQSEGGWAIPAVSVSENRKQRRILTNRQFLPLRESPPAWRETSRKLNDLSQDRKICSETRTRAVARWNDAAGGNQEVHGQRRLVVVELFSIAPRARDAAFSRL
jgi:hypothetical protein